MQNTYKPGDLTPEQERRLHYETGVMRSRVERGIIDDLNTERTAAERDSEQPDITDSGKIFRQIRRKDRKTFQKQKEMEQLATVFGLSTAAELLKGVFNNGVELLRAIAASPLTGASVQTANSKTQKINPLYAYEDGNMAFETAQVSFATAAEIQRQTQIIHAKCEEMEASSHLDQKHKLGREILSLAQEFQMRQHPITLQFVHEVEAVEAMEAKYNPDGGEVLCEAEVCIVRLKCSGVDRLGIKRVVSDVFNQDPAEVQLTQSERIEIAHTQQAPHLTHS